MAWSRFNSKIIFSSIVVLFYVVIASATQDNPQPAIHVAFGTAHFTGHLTPFLALAKSFKLQYPQARVSFVVTSFGLNIAKKQLEKFGIEVVSAGGPSWTEQEDHKVFGELMEKSPIDRITGILNVFGIYERTATSTLIEHYSHSVKPDFLVIDPMISGIVNTADYFSIPYLFYHTSGLPLMDSWNSFFVNNPVHINISPFSAPSDDVVSSPLKRLSSKATSLVMLVMGYVMGYSHNQIRAEFNLPASPGIRRSNKLPTPILLSTAWGLAEPMSLPPYVQLVGSVFDPEISPAPPISDTLAQWLDADDRPIVYVSTGTTARFTEEQLTSVATAFNSLDQYRFLWSLRREKYSNTTEIPELKSHILMQNFVPQATVLAHKNVKVFFSHCGQNSMLESIWARVPVLALPFMGDQPRNAHLLVSNHAALLLPSTNITTEIVASSLSRLISDRTFTDNLDRLASLLEIAGGKEQASRWIWLIANHGSSFLMPKELEVGWFLYYELDILSAQIGLILVVVLIGWLMKRCCWYCCCRRRNSKVQVTSKEPTNDNNTNEKKRK